MMVPYKKNGQMTKKNRRARNIPVSFNPNQLVYDLGFGAVEGAGNLAVKAVKGIVSAFQNRGASRQEISAIVAPLAKSLTYTSRKPKFTKAEGGLAIEHIENVHIQTNGHTFYTVDSNLFLWLKGIANQFEEYQIKLWFGWNPVCPATVAGQVMMAFDYDPADNVVGAYVEAPDYFNTADHCVNAIWAPGALSPQKSGWLKTGNDGDVRLFSPGKLHVNVTDRSYGYLTVKYQVALRKPQPSAADSGLAFHGTFSTGNGIFANHTFVGGDSRLIASITDTQLILAPSPGYKILVWSTDANLTALAPGLSAARQIGVRTGSGSSFVAVVAPGVAGHIDATVGAPVGTHAYKLFLHTVDINPLDFDF